MGRWRCPECGMTDGEHAMQCEVTDDAELVWDDEEEEGS